MVCFRFSRQYNDSYAFREYPTLTDYQRIHQELVPDVSGAPRAGVRRCEKCGELLAKWDESLEGLVIKRRTYDISVTYDGVVVVSKTFEAACRKNRLSGLVFRPLPDDPAFFDIQATKMVQFDAERRKTRFLKRCGVCGRYESIVGATPVLLKQWDVIGDREIVRTDLEFGSMDGKSPLLLCGVTAAESLRKTDLKGLDLVECQAV